MKAIITAIGVDQVGVVHSISGLLKKYNLNIINLNQNIMDDYFTMIVIVGIDKANADFSEIVEAFEELGKELKLELKIQHEDIFNSMYNI